MDVNRLERCQAKPPKVQSRVDHEILFKKSAEKKKRIIVTHSKVPDQATKDSEQGRS